MASIERALRGTRTHAVTHADLLLLGGRVWTGRPDCPWADALAVAGERILAVGRADDLLPQAGPGTRRIDTRGLLVVPGFHDSHVHFAAGCLQLGRVQLKDAADEAEFGRRLQEFSSPLTAGAWLVGGRWDHDHTFGGALPTAALLDRYVPDRPAFLRRYDGHMAVANSAALRIAGVGRETCDPPAGKVVRDPLTGEPTGALLDAAMDLVWRHIPDPGVDEIAAALPGGFALAARQGITSVHDMLGDGGPCLEAYRKALERDELTTRLHLYWPMDDRKAAAELAREAPSAWLRVCGAKAFVDGSLGSSTAWFHEPYAHEPDHCGLPVVDMRQLAETMRAADMAGLQLAVHAIGDRAVTELLDAWEAVVAANGPQDRRLRMEHAQHVRSADVLRMARLGVIASVQPYHVIDDGRWVAGRIGDARGAEAFVYRSLLDMGVRLAFGSDWPVAPLDALAGIDAAVNRRTLDGKHPDGWHAEQCVIVEEALGAYTSAAAHAVFAERGLGTLEPGKLADLVVLSEDITRPTRRDSITDAEVLLTVVGGRVVYDALD
jgi:predicted amidohydrolase YtcJ